MLRGKVAACD